MGLRTLGFHLLLCQYLIQHTRNKIANNEEWNAMRCCQNCPNLNSIVHAYNDMRYVKICQHGTAGRVSHFATLFDTVNRIPVFSKFKVHNTCRVIGTKPFLFEVQLVGQTPFGNIGGVAEIKKQLNLTSEQAGEEIRTKHATDSDYNRTGFDKGHLRPVAGCENTAAEIATYTYTNAVPQVFSFNRGVWKSVERETRNFIAESRCFGDNVVVVGAVPSSDKLNWRVNIPSFLWSYIECANDIVVFLAPNINNNHIKKYQLVTAFFTVKNNLAKVLLEIRDLDTVAVGHLGGENLSGNQLKQFTGILNILTQFQNYVQDKLIAIQPTGEGDWMFKQLGCTGSTHLKTCTGVKKSCDTGTRVNTREAGRKRQMNEELEENNTGKRRKFSC